MASGVHIRGYYLVYFDSLNHVGRNQVELYVTGITSAEGTRLPLTVTELRSALVPRTCPKRLLPGRTAR